MTNLVKDIQNILKMPSVNAFNSIDKVLGIPIIFTIIVIFQGLFGGLGVPHTPKRLSGLSDSPIFRMLFVVAIAYTATGDVETAAIATAIVLGGLHAIRTPEERKEVPYFV